MEYLTTYGWSILVIAVVVLALYVTGAFGGGAGAFTSSCLAQSGFECKGPMMNTTGNVLVTFGEDLGAGIGITGTACISGSSGTPSSFNSITANVVSGETLSMVFQCPLASNAIGAAFTGTLWIQYTKSGQTGQVSQIATLTAKSVTSNSLGSSGGGSSYTSPTVSLSSCPSPASVTSGSSVSCSATVSGGTSSYTYNWIVVNSITDAVVASQVYTGVSSTSNTFSYTTSSSDTSNSPEAFNVIVTDAHPTTVGSAYSGTFAITSGSSPSGGAYAYVPITLTNSQSSATSANFQQMVFFNPTTYSANEMANMSNIEFTSGAPIGTSGNVPLYSWIESGASSSATNSVVWVNLGGSTIAGSGGTLTIYMNFMTGNTPVTSGYTGYAPQLWCASGCFQSSDAQYDNGANVFTWYDNGNTITNFALANGGTLTLTSQTNPYGVTSNVITLTGTGGSTGTAAETVAWNTAPVIGANFIMEGWEQITAVSTGEAFFAAMGSSDTALTNYLFGMDEDVCACSETIYSESGTTSTLMGSAGGTTTATAWHWQTANVFGADWYDALYSAPPELGGTLVGRAATPEGNVGSPDTYIGIGMWAGVTANEYFYTMRIRASPPAGVMPGFSFGSVSVA
ncbi:MAG: hypothetical protein M1321_00220 [Candidatus Marsarchaeota archaeon]|nr:hypothetical protein [Candidatus Marsarchaeota archaeon]